MRAPVPAAVIAWQLPAVGPRKLGRARPEGVARPFGSSTRAVRPSAAVRRLARWEWPRFGRGQSTFGTPCGSRRSLCTGPRRSMMTGPVAESLREPVPVETGDNRQCRSSAFRGLWWRRRARAGSPTLGGSRRRRRRTSVQGRPSRCPLDPGRLRRIDVGAPSSHPADLAHRVILGEGRQHAGPDVAGGSRDYDPHVTLDTRAANRKTA